MLVVRHDQRHLAQQGRTLRPTGCVKKESQPELWYTYICLLAASLTFSALWYTRTKTRT